MMSAMRLTRELRCFPLSSERDGPVLNSWAGGSGGDRLEPFGVLRATVSGPVDQRTGYLCDIRRVDELLRDIAVPGLAGDVEGAEPLTAPCIALRLRGVYGRIAAGCPNSVALESLEFQSSPYLRHSVVLGATAMVQLTRSYEFSAAHRLFCDGLSDEENRRLFGKCSNPNGHGHNYVVDVTVRAQPEKDRGLVIELPRMDEIVKERVVDTFDHKNLNVECSDFADLNPTVENIARVVWRRLRGAFEPAELASVRVWETPKTCAEYAGED